MNGVTDHEIEQEEFKNAVDEYKRHLDYVTGAVDALAVEVGEADRETLSVLRWDLPFTVEVGELPDTVRAWREKILTGLDGHAPSTDRPGGGPPHTAYLAAEGSPRSLMAAARRVAIAFGGLARAWEDLDGLDQRINDGRNAIHELGVYTPGRDERDVCPISQDVSETAAELSAWSDEVEEALAAPAPNP